MESGAEFLEPPRGFQKISKRRNPGGISTVAVVGDGEAPKKPRNPNDPHQKRVVSFWSAFRLQAFPPPLQVFLRVHQDYNPEPFVEVSVRLHAFSPSANVSRNSRVLEYFRPARRFLGTPGMAGFAVWEFLAVPHG